MSNIKHGVRIRFRSGNEVYFENATAWETKAEGKIVVVEFEKQRLNALVNGQEVEYVIPGDCE